MQTLFVDTVVIRHHEKLFMEYDLFSVKSGWANAIRPYGQNHYWPKR